ncbi:MAG TPA: aminomethyl-transferring glycine dehydrogenase subunit GcvPA [Candidatus Marinimicrobia bacterium]|nr:aminomethyl-transferring glycine dehydrogenase subunit GcvPA [Candidatus Neomarinimicrobiota bacterium]
MVYIPNTDADRQKMLESIGVDSFEKLIESVPYTLRENVSLELPEPLSELEIEQELERLAAKNLPAASSISFMGGGAYDHFIPKVVDFLISRSEFYTAYTPYQAEVSQGTLQAMYEYQSMICALTGMDVSNASMYDGATAMTEAAMMAKSLSKSNRILVSAAVHPHYLKVLKTYAESLKLEIVMVPLLENGVTNIGTLSELLKKSAAAVIVQSPNFFGLLEECEPMVELAHQAKALFIQGADPIGLAIFKAPGDINADIVFAEGQSLGNHLNFGGPYLGVFAAKGKYIRKMPGRIVGATLDAQGRRGFVLNLQTREQHIRREKATSNICTNQGLVALASTIYMALMGKNGLRKVAELCAHKAHYLMDEICKVDGFSRAYNAPFFKEFVIKTPRPSREILIQAAKENILFGIPLERFFPERTHELLIAVTEKRTKADLDVLVNFFRSL